MVRASARVGAKVAPWEMRDGIVGRVGVRLWIVRDILFEEEAMVGRGLRRAEAREEPIAPRPMRVMLCVVVVPVVVEDIIAIGPG